jgi:hypothetical protein
MWASSQMLEAEARRKAEDKAAGIHRVALSPAALKRRLAKKKAAERAAKAVGNGRPR